MQKPWPESAVERAVALWQGGFSASEIGQRLGFSRNAVIGKMNRLGIVQMPVSKAAWGKVGGKARRKGQPVHPPRKPMPPEPSLPFHMPAARATGVSAALLNLHYNDCRWPIGDPRADDFRFCGAARVPAISYCEHHYIASINPYRKDEP